MTIEQVLLIVLGGMTGIIFALLIAVGFHLHKAKHRHFELDPDLTDPIVITEKDGEVYIQSLGQDERWHIGHIDGAA